MTDSEQEKAKQECMRALKCLYLQVPESVANDVAAKVNAVLSSKEAELAELRKDKLQLADDVLGAWKKRGEDAESQLAALREQVSTLRDMVRAITKVDDFSFDPETQKYETTDYDFVEVWHMGESRIRHQFERYKKETREQLERLTSERDAIKGAAFRWREEVGERLANMETALPEIDEMTLEDASRNLEGGVEGDSDVSTAIRCIEAIRAMKRSSSPSPSTQEK